MNVIDSLLITYIGGIILQLKMHLCCRTWFILVLVNVLVVIIIMLIIIVTIMVTIVATILVIIIVTNVVMIIVTILVSFITFIVIMLASNIASIFLKPYTHQHSKYQHDVSSFFQWDWAVLEIFDLWCVIPAVGDDIPKIMIAFINKWQLEVLTIWHTLFDVLIISNSRDSANYTVSLVLCILARTMIMWVLPCKFFYSHSEFMKTV